MEAIGHLPEALIGAKIIPQPKEPKDKLPSLCEECHLANFLQCQISRYPPQRATKPFELEWIPHSMETIGLCILFAIRPEPFRLYVSSEPTLKTAFVKWQYNVEIQIWHTDGKKTMEIILCVAYVLQHADGSLKFRAEHFFFSGSRQNSE